MGLWPTGCPALVGWPSRGFSRALLRYVSRVEERLFTDKFLKDAKESCEKPASAATSRSISITATPSHPGSEVGIAGLETISNGNENIARDHDAIQPFTRTDTEQRIGASGPASAAQPVGAVMQENTNTGSLPAISCNQDLYKSSAFKVLVALDIGLVFGIFAFILWMLLMYDLNPGTSFLTPSFIFGTLGTFVVGTWMVWALFAFFFSSIWRPSGRV